MSPTIPHITRIAWRDLLLDDVGDARRVLRELLEGPIQFTPVLDETPRGFRFAGAITIGGMLEGTAVSKAWRPRAEPAQTTPWRVPFGGELIVATAA